MSTPNNRYIMKETIQTSFVLEREARDWLKERSENSFRRSMTDILHEIIYHDKESHSKK